MHLLAPAPFGGLEQVVRSLAGEQARAGLDVHIGAILDPGAADPGPLEALAQLGVAVHLLRPPPRAYGRERREVAALLGRIRPHVVHTHGYRTDVLHGSTARRLGMAAVATTHGFTGGDWKNRLYEWLQCRALRRYDAVVAVSRPMAARLAAAGVPAERTHWVPNAWTGGVSFLERSEARRRLGLDAAAPCVGFIGRISREKGPDTFVDAVARLDGAVTGVLIGEGRMRTELARRAQAQALGSALRWAGAIDGAASLMPAFDAVVLSSRTEGTPVVLLEAMAAGVPVVATAVGGVPDVISEREGLLVPAEDPPRLAAALREVIEKPDVAALRAERAGERLRSEFGARRWLERYDEVYRSCGVAVAGSA